MTAKRKPTREVGAMAAAAIAIAAIGFVTGTTSEARDPSGSRVTTMPHASDEVPSYGDPGSLARGKNRGLHDGALAALGDRLPSRMAEVKRDGDLPAVRAARRARRAFDGAPPTIPHPIDQRGYPACSSCHERGAVIGDRIAPAMSHGALGSCTQCHVSEVNAVAAEDTLDLAQGNSFAAFWSPERGARSFEGAPPSVPHHTAMRERCDSCHGVAGANPIRTTHPDRQSCRQCHVETDATAPAAAAFPVARARAP